MLWKYIGRQPAGLAATFAAGAGAMEPGAVFERQPGLAGAGAADWKELPDPRDRPRPASAAELAAECDSLASWVRKGLVPWQAPPAPHAAARRVVHGRMGQLIDAAAALGLASNAMPTLDLQSPVRALGALDELRAWAERRAAGR